MVDGIVLIEPLTEGENGEYPLHTAADVLSVIEQVGADNVKLLLDVYHLTNNGDDVPAIIESHFDTRVTTGTSDVSTDH